jgi:uncharacterized membrane protein YhhN
VTGLAVALLVVFAVAAVANWVAVAGNAAGADGEALGHGEYVAEPWRQRVEYVAKPLALVALVGVALALEPADSAVRAWFVAALVLSLAGDVLLMLPSDRFVAGLAAFLLAHLAYVGGLVADGVTAVGLTIGLAVVGVAVGLVGVPLLRGVRRAEPAMTVPVGAYVVVISAMVLCAVGTGNGLAIAGAASFYASDALIGLTRFVRPAVWAPVAIMVTYHVGQALLTLSLA